MKLASFTFHPSPIQVDGKPLHGVRVGTDGVTDIALHDGALIVSRGTQIWFTHTSFGTGVPEQRWNGLDELEPDTRAIRAAKSTHARRGVKQ